MSGKRESRRDTSEKGESIAATPAQIDDLGQVVRAAWHGLRQGRNFLPPSYAHYIAGDTVVIRLGDEPGRYQETRLVLEDDGTSWRIENVIVQPQSDTTGQAGGLLSGIA